MPCSTRARAAAAALFIVLLTCPRGGRAQEQVGHKLLGTLGLKAGSEPKPGLYLVDSFGFYHAGELADRNGNAIPAGLQIDGAGGAFGVLATFRIPHTPIFLSAAGALPLAHVSLRTSSQKGSIARSGLGDLYVEPLKLGWRGERVELVTNYSFYAPTGRFTDKGSGGIGYGQWTHEFSLGGTVYFDSRRTWHLSALASYDINLRKRSVDITRGATLQVQGGVGKTLSSFFDAGIAAYALWQMTDDSGSALPPMAQGAREQAYGLGPEIDLLVMPILGRLTVRYVHDLSAASRPVGQLFFVTWTALACRFGDS
jgi:hypothetical protein